MRPKEVLLKLNLLVVFCFLLIQKSKSETNQTNDSQTQQKSDKNSEPNHLISRNGGTVRRPADNGSLAEILVVDPNDPNQHPQPPLIFTSEHNPPEPVFGHINHNEDNFNFWSGNTTVEINGRPTETGAPQFNREPPFFVMVEPKSTKSLLKTIDRNRRPNPDKVSKSPDTMPGFKPQPLPPSTKPVSEKKDCVVLGRAGSCFPFYPLRNVFECFTSGGIVAMDIVRCSWVRACCVPNFF